MIRADARTAAPRPTERPDPWRQPRDLASARHLLVVLLNGSALITSVILVFSWFVPVSATPWWWFVVPLSIIPAALVARRHPPPARSLAWVVLPLIGVAIIGGLNLVNDDGSAAAQMFMLLPVLWASSQLYGPAAVTVTVTAIALDVVTAFCTLPLEVATTDAVYVSLTLAITSVVLIRSSARQQRLVRRLEGIASVDALTGLVTRRVLDEQANAMLAAPQHGGGTAMLLIDVDRFKQVNDRFGHVVGDDALVHVADVLRRSVRPDVLISRLGGDEIAAVIPRCGLDAALRRAEAVADEIRRSPIELPDGRRLHLTVSIGVAHAPTHARDLHDLYVAADAALYAAKEGGRDRTCAAPAAA